MTSTLIRIFGAACSAMLLHFSYDFSFGPLLAVAAVIILTAVSDKTGLLLQCIQLSVFYCVFICVQGWFIIAKVTSGETIIAMLLLPLAVSVLHIIPACMCVLLFRKRRIESLLIGLLISEFLFVQFELGNQCFQIGTSLAAIPSSIQYYKLTGIWGGSALVVFVGYCIYRSIQNRKWLLPLSYVLCALVCINVILSSANGTDGKTVNVCVVSLGMEKDRVGKAAGMLNDTVAASCNYILWPEGVVMKRESAYKFDPLLTRCMRLADKYGTMTYFGLGTAIGNLQSNSIVAVRGNTISRRFKEHLIPFSEYVPYENVLNRIPVIRDNILYPLAGGSTSYVMSENDNICPLICYESLSTEYMCAQVNNGAELFFVSSSNEYINNKHMERVTERILQSNAVLLDRDIVRSVTNGRSMHIDSGGNALEMPYSSTSTKVVPATFSKGLTFYAKHRKFVDMTYCALLFLLILFANHKDSIFHSRRSA